MAETHGARAFAIDTRQFLAGQADMAVSSSVGSNIFDILVAWAERVRGTFGVHAVLVAREYRMSLFGVRLVFRFLG